MSDICILISVYHPYRWVARHTYTLIEKYWPSHPSLFFCGLTSEEAGDLPHIPCLKPALPRVWADFVCDAAQQLADRGFSKCYFLLEDHPPLAPCHAEHLEKTLPRLMDELGGAYIGLMGWDNRRFTTQAPILPENFYRLMHLNIPSAPRFHLHPSLFKMEALIACLELIKGAQPTPWGFEKLCDKNDAALPEVFKDGCYQICGELMTIRPASPAKLAANRAERFFYHKLMTLYPILQKLGWGRKFWDALGFDDYYYDGPFPMFFSGVMAKGKLNPPFIRYVSQQKDASGDFQRLLDAAAKETAA